MERDSDLEKAESSNGGKLCQYYRDSDLTWKQHLQADSFAQDTTGEIIKRGGEGIKAVISDRTREIIASNDALVREFGTGFDSVNSTLEWGLSQVTSEISELRADFRYGIVLVLEQLRIQQETLDGILDQLDAIHETLKYPLLTQARELSKIGMERLQKGLLPEALDAFLKSLEKNETDFLVQLQIGKLYLYGQNPTDNVIDLPSAEKHLRLAARYAYREIQHLPNAAKFCGEAFLHAAISCYAQATEKRLAGDAEATKHFTEQAMELSKNAAEVHPQLTEAFYHHAKFAALLGDDETAVDSLRTAIEADRNYCLKADADSDFDGVRESIFNLFESLRQQAKQEATKTIETVKKLPKDWVYQSAEAKQAEVGIRKALGQSESYSNKETYFDSLDALSSVKEAKENFDQISPFSFEEIATLSGKLPPVFSPDSKYLASGSSDYTWKIYQADGFKEIATLNSKLSPVFSPDSKYLASGSSDYTCIIYQVDGFKEITTLNSKLSPAFSPDGKYLVSGGRDYTYKIYQTDGFKEITTLSGMWSPVFSSDGGYLAVKSSYDTCEIYQADGFKEITTLSSMLSPVFSPDGKYLAISSKSSPVFSADSRYLAIESSDYTWKIYQTDRFKNITSSKLPPIFSPDSKYFTNESSDYTWKIYQTDGFKEITTLSSKLSPVFSSDGRHLAIESSDYTWKIYQTDGFKEIATLSSKLSPVFSPDGRHLAIESSDYTWKIYQTDGFKETATLSSKSSPVFSPDGRYLTSRSSDDTWKIYQRIKCTISPQEFEEQERNKIEAEKKTERLMKEERRGKEEEERRKKEEEERRKKEAECKRKEKELRKFRLKNKLCLECGAKLSFLDKLSGAQHCKLHRK